VLKINTEYNLFQGRKLLIATKHHKEKVIAPILEAELGVECFVLPDFETDVFGTFTREVERRESPFSTLRQKCYKAFEESDADLVVASEGSFGPHPVLFYVPVDEELVLLIDKKNNLEIGAKEISTTTNFMSAEIHLEEELIEFANKAKFPSHGLIVRNSQDYSDHFEKGITSWEKLFEVFRHFKQNYGTVYLETDMRAMYNPTRMQIIEQVTQKLVLKIKSLCPECQTPGFGITETIQGLPCQICQYPTRSILSYIYSCQKCGFSKEEKYPNGKTTEDPGLCDCCNP